MNFEYLEIIYDRDDARQGTGRSVHVASTRFVTLLLKAYDMEAVIART